MSAPEISLDPEADAIFDRLYRQLDGLMPAELITDLAAWVLELVRTARREGRQDGLWEA
jgi:hypothetical protein